MNTKNTPIVVVAFNRPRSLSRLLNSLQKANYKSQDIDLIISIDKASNNHEVLAVATEFVWQYGTKKVNYQRENLGLRAHILQCGSISQEYGSVLILEDDLYVAPNFYEYTLQALAFSQDKKYLGGISLYNHQFNVHVSRNFSPIEDGFDNWYFQFASSWGQAWTKAQWDGFITWYNMKPELTKISNIPYYLTTWSDKSWLKYNIAYLIEKNLYFLYPKISLSTNFSDAGTHMGQDSTKFQVALDYAPLKKYIFSNLESSNAIYDAFYENRKLAKIVALLDKDLTVDLYGYKNEFESNYLLSSQILDFKIVKSYGKSLKPIDSNILEGIDGTDLFLYDTSVKEINTYKLNIQRRLLYNSKYISNTDAWCVIKSELRRKVLKFIKIILRK